MIKLKLDDSHILVNESCKSKKSILEKIPVSRLGEPQDIASACVYLASDEASFVTGSTLHVNGGMGMF